MDRAYLETLQRYYEEEIEGEAYFAELARVFHDPGQTARLRLLARIERHAARGVAPLIARHGLVPRDAGTVAASGRAAARATAPDWAALIAGMQASYPGYLADFRRLEATGPPEDRPWLAFLSEHEVAALEFLALEAAGAPESCAPLERYLASAPPSGPGAT